MISDQTVKTLVGSCTVLATGAESIPDLWKAVIGLVGIAILGKVIYKIMIDRIGKLEEIISNREESAEEKDKKLIKAEKEASKYKALYEALKQTEDSDK